MTTTEKGYSAMLWFQVDVTRRYQLLLRLHFGMEILGKVLDSSAGFETTFSIYCDYVTVWKCCLRLTVFSGHVAGKFDLSDIMHLFDV